MNIVASLKNLTAESYAFMLSLAGWLPFAALTLLILLLGQYPTWSHILINYGCVILSFLGGVQWGVAITIKNASSRLNKSVLTLSVLPPLAAWMILSSNFSIGTQLNIIIFLFIMMSVTDIFLVMNKLIDSWFLKLRCVISLLVVATLFIARYGMH
jgi:hypothetical protein